MRILRTLCAQDFEPSEPARAQDGRKVGRVQSAPAAAHNGIGRPPNRFPPEKILPRSGALPFGQAVVARGGPRKAPAHLLSWPKRKRPQGIAQRPRAQGNCFQGTPLGCHLLKKCSLHLLGFVAVLRVEIGVAVARPALFRRSRGSPAAASSTARPPPFKVPHRRLARPEPPAQIKGLPRELEQRPSLLPIS